MPCRITARQEITARIVLESILHDKAVFVTLTYSPENLPEAKKYPGGNLEKTDLQKFFKRLRFNCSRNHPAQPRIRYYGVGEYGDKSQRAHYHAIIYGIDRTDARYIADSWTLGLVHIGDLSPDSAQYCARYTTKKITGEPAGDHYGGRNPEFHISSRKPALGDGAAYLIAETLSAPDSRNFIIDGVIRIRGRKLPLDAFMRKRISQYMVELGTDPLITCKAERLSFEDMVEARDKSHKLASRYAKKTRGKI